MTDRTILRKKLVSISSAHRDSGTSSDFRASFVDSKVFTNTHRIKLDKVSIPNSFHNLPTSTFSYVISNLPATWREFTIQKGQYSSTDIINLFATYVATYAGTEALTIDNNTKKFVMTSSSGNIGIGFSNMGLDTDLGYLLGFENIEYVATTANAVNSPALHGEQTVYVHFDFLTGNCLSLRNSQLQQDVLTMVQMSEVAFGETLHYIGNEYDSVEFANGKNTSNFRCYLTDGNGVILDLNGLDFEMLLTIYYHP